MQQFEADAHPEVIIAMRQTITNMLGTLPPQFFRVVISTEAENLAQLMYSVLMSGYMFANAWTRLGLTQSLAELPAGLLDSPELVGSSSLAASGSLPASSSAGGGSGSVMDAAAYAPGSQKMRVEGEVLRWHHENGKEVVPALQYIEQLEAELADLRQQMEAAQAAQEAQAAMRREPMPGNQLLDYLKCLAPEELLALTDCASEDVLEAMNQFVTRLMGMEEEAWQGGTSDCTAGELAQLMYWLMITGYTLRQLEQRCDLTRTLDLPPPGSDPPSLPPGPPSAPPSMLSKALSKAPTLRLASAAPAAAAWAASGRLAGALGAWGYPGGKAAGAEDSYEQMKEAARRSGDPAKEWMQGAKGKASAYAENAEQTYEAAKRGTQEVTARARESARETLHEASQKASHATGGDMESMKAGASQAASEAGSKISDAASRAAQAVQETVGGDVTSKVSQAAASAAEAVKGAFAPEDLSGPGKGLPSARAKFEAGRSEEVKARENADRKSQLTDEATTGDNPMEQRTRDEHEILDSEFYTRH
ncbi:seed maturation [Chlorella sorokiniana]|uniref:Seed maturation n=1 Tax=Chlorella sorokiniana TaxID=3076 RepID=A0A2P6TN04_CHLSO|nr:seed maturation [Chlorella sorokiniana]|eukprot:PRW45716.1 seed maturation [Chlorella sorokiniana]